MPGLGKIQRRIQRGFVANPGARLTTGDLVRWSYPRWTEPVQHRSYSAITAKAKQLQDAGLLEVKRCRPTNPDPQDFDEAKRCYCRKHHASIAKLCARLERDDQLAELYRLAQAAKRAGLFHAGGHTGR